jgi:hypothetical protein
MVVADFDIPVDLVELQRAWYAADVRCQEISVVLPRAADVVAGVAEPTGQQRDELTAARAERLRLSEALQGHGWWADVEPEHRLEAKAALRDAARL